MMNTTLQLMANAPGISRADVDTDTPGVRITGIVRPGSPNYLIVYLDISAATPGRVSLRITLDGTERTVEYELRPRRADLGSLGRLSCADVVYLLLPDRFAQGRTGNGSVSGMMPYRTDRSEPSLRHGGDLEGIRRHLEYFTELGVTALWLTPVLENNSPDSGRASSYHGYAITDFYRTDPRLGTNDDYRRLVAEAHQRGLKVVMDMVFNHCGIWHPWLRDLPSADWINHPEWLAKTGGAEKGAKYLQTNYRLTPTVDPYAAEADLRETTEGWFVTSMPDLNQHNPHLMTYLSQCSKWWIETSGADAIRMDTYPYAFADAMAGWAKEMSEEYPWLNIIGETWVTEPAFTASWQRGSAISRRDTGLQTVMDFALFDRLNTAKGEETDDFQAGLNRVYNTFAYDFLYNSPENVLAFIDNHDTERFLGNGCDISALRQALAVILVARRIPQIYYGTEILMNGTKELSDGNVRRDFPGGFPGDGPGAFTPAGRTRAQRVMFGWLSRLLKWRRDCEAVTRGSMKHFIPHGGVYVIHRHSGGCNALLVLNGTSRPATFRARRYAECVPPGTMAREVTSDRLYYISRDLRLHPRQTLVMEY